MQFCRNYAFGLTAHLAVVAAVLIFSTTSALAGELPPRWKSGEFSLGGYLAVFDTDARADSDQLGRGSDIKFEDRLNLEEDVTSLRADGYWRFYPRHRIEATFYDISRDGGRSIDRDIQFRDRVFNVGASVETKFDLTVYKAAYAYSVVQNERWDGALSIGMFGADVSAELTGQIQGLGFGIASGDFFAPLPVVGGRLWYAISEDFTLKFDLDLFALEFGDYDGSLVDAKIAVDYDLTDWFGLTLGYNYVAIDVDKTGGDFTGSVNYQYDAVIFAGRVFF
jgi:hypothetical protein